MTFTHSVWMTPLRKFQLLSALAIVSGKKAPAPYTTHSGASLNASMASDKHAALYEKVRAVNAGLLGPVVVYGAERNCLDSRGLWVTEAEYGVTADALAAHDRMLAEVIAIDRADSKATALAEYDKKLAEKQAEDDRLKAEALAWREASDAKLQKNRHRNNLNLARELAILISIPALRDSGRAHSCAEHLAEEHVIARQAGRDCPCLDCSPVYPSADQIEEYRVQRAEDAEAESLRRQVEQAREENARLRKNRRAA